jgi:anti-sigma-K factor RskA
MSEGLQQELSEALTLLTVLKRDLETQRSLVETSQAELTAVSSLLRQAERGLQSLTKSYENSVRETALQQDRTTKAERRMKLWRTAAFIAAALALGGITATAVF